MYTILPQIFCFFFLGGSSVLARVGGGGRVVTSVGGGGRLVVSVGGVAVSEGRMSPKRLDFP